MIITPWKLVFAAIVLAIWFDFLFYKAIGIGLNVFLFELAILAILFLFPHKKKGDIALQEWVLGGFGIAFSATFAIWTSSIGLRLSMLGLLTTNVFLLLSLFEEQLEHRHPFQFIPRSLVRFGDALRGLNIVARLRVQKVSDKTSVILRGVLIALPIVAIFAFLFIASDQILSLHTETFFNRDWFQNSEDIVAQTIIIVFSSLAALGILSALFWKESRAKHLATHTPVFRTESTIILLGTTVLFLAFILFQSYYLFGGQTAWQSIEGITYSQYAVQGFNELAVVAALVLLLILSLRFFHGESANMRLKGLEVALIVETFILLVSAWMRLHLYVQQYGFTPARLFGFWFFITVSITLVGLAIHIFKEQHQGAFTKHALVMTGCAMLIFTAMAPDSLSVRLNIAQAQKAHEPIDTWPLYRHLSAEAYPLMQYSLNKFEHNFEQSKLELQTKKWDETLCLAVDENGNARSGEKGVYYFRDRINWKNWNLSRTQLPVCTQTPIWNDRSFQN